jgi:DNA polymerase III delta prime subunit
MYKENLIALLEGLECNNIDKLIDQDPKILNAVGKEIALNVKTNDYKGLIQIYRQYHALLNEVQNEYDDESKFETALRIIKENQGKMNNEGIIEN